MRADNFSNSETIEGKIIGW